MILFGVVLMAVAVLLMVLLAQSAVVVAGRFRRITAVATLGVIMVVAAIFATGLVLTGVTAILSLGVAG
ncbi:hypothetical protein [Kocuria sp.]|jgi:hypothetical protein|nr:hypothetical protein [Kocuria sp.]HST72028.1 hypothetical protein [Kocuria rosea]